VGEVEIFGDIVFEILKLDYLELEAYPSNKIKITSCLISPEMKGVEIFRIYLQYSYVWLP